jgi:glycosyltransferase involved in cell wall biosynthesis
LVVNGKTGLVVRKKNPAELKKAIIKVYENRSLCKEFGTKSRERIATRLNTDRTIKEYKQFYTSLINK